VLKRGTFCPSRSTLPTSRRAVAVVGSAAHIVAAVAAGLDRTRAEAAPETSATGRTRVAAETSESADRTGAAAAPSTAGNSPRTSRTSWIFRASTNRTEPVRPEPERGAARRGTVLSLMLLFEIYCPFLYLWE